MHGYADLYLLGVAAEGVHQWKLHPIEDLYELLADHTSCGVADF